MDKFIKVKRKRTSIVVDIDGKPRCGVVYEEIQLINLRHVVRIEISEAYDREGVIKGEFTGRIVMDDGNVTTFYPYTSTSVECILKCATENEVYELTSRDMQEGI